MSNIERAQEALDGPRPRIYKFIELIRAIGGTHVNVDLVSGGTYALQAPTGYGIIEERDKDLETAVERGLGQLIKWRIR